MKNVQIPYELFVNLVLYHLNGEDDFDEEYNGPLVKTTYVKFIVNQIFPNLTLAVA